RLARRGALVDVGDVAATAFIAEQGVEQTNSHQARLRNCLAWPVSAACASAAWPIAGATLNRLPRPPAPGATGVAGSGCGANDGTGVAAASSVKGAEGAAGGGVTAPPLPSPRN